MPWGAKLKKLFLISAALLAAISSAQSADLQRVYTKAPVAAVSSWAGFYAGVSGGYAWDDPTVTFTGNTPNTGVAVTGLPFATAAGVPSASRPSFDIAGGFGGVQAGYNWQLAPSWIAGLEADFSGGNISGSGSAIVDLGTALTALSAEDKVKWFGTVRARLGFLATPNLMIFGSGGFAYGRVNQSATVALAPPTLSTDFIAGPGTVTCDPGIPCLSGSSSRVAPGWTAGAGAEYLIGTKWTMRVEYLYVNLGKNTFLQTASNTTNAANTVTTAFSDTAFNLVRFGVNYHF